MPPYSSKQHLDISDISLTDSDRFGSASSDELQWPHRDCSSINGHTATVKHQQHRVRAQMGCSPKLSNSLTSRCCARRSSFDSHDAEALRRSLQSDELMSTLTPPPPPPSTRSPNKQRKAVQETVEKYKELYEAMLHDVLDALEADDPSADGRLSDHGAAHATDEAGRKSAAHNDNGTSDDETLGGCVDDVANVKQVEDPPAAAERGLDPPPLMSDDLLKHIIARVQSQDSLSDSTIVIDFDDESHDIMSLLSEINDRKKDNALVPVNKKRSSATKSNRQPRRDDVKRRTSNSDVDRRREMRPSPASTSKPKERTDEKKRHEEIQRQLSRSKSPFARFIRGRSPPPTNDVRGAATTASRSKSKSKSPYNTLRSISPFRLNRSSSTGQQNSSGASVSSNKNSSIGRQRSLSSSRERPGRRPSNSDLSGDTNHTLTNGSSDEKKKAKLFKKMKTFASSLKQRLDESKKLLPSSSASHKFKVGDMAEYNIGSRVCLEDLNLLHWRRRLHKDVHCTHP